MPALLNGFPICFRANANIRLSAFLLHPRETYEYKGFFPVLCVTSCERKARNSLKTWELACVLKSATYSSDGIILKGRGGGEACSKGSNGNEQTVGARRTNILTTFVISPLSKESEPIASSTCVYEER